MLRLEKKYTKALFDMDGTLVDSRLVVERVWEKWAEKNGLDLTAILATSHGRRAMDTVRDFAKPDMDIDSEVAWLAKEEIADVEGIVAIGGAKALLDRLDSDDWAVVTSADRALAIRRLEAAGLPVPKTLITSEDVRRGKPDPEGYTLAASRLGATTAQCLVFEDAPAGIRAGLSAGCDVVAIAAAQPHTFDALCPTIMDFTALSFDLG